MATQTLNQGDLFTILTIGSDEYFLEGYNVGSKFNDESGSSCAPDVEQYEQEEEEEITLDNSQYLVDDIGNIASFLVGGRPKKARRR